MWDWNRKEKLVICEVCGVGSEISPSVGLELMRYMLADYDQAMVGSEISPSVGLERLLKKCRKANQGNVGSEISPSAGLQYALLQSP